MQMFSWLGLGLCLVAAGAQADTQMPRGANGKPNLSGIWQALNEANYDVEQHVARPAMALQPGPHGPLPAAKVLALGAVGAVPPGIGVTDGAIPYLPQARRKRDENRAHWLERDPEIKCYLPGIPRATYLPQPFQIAQSDSALFFAYQYAGAVRDVFLEDPGEAPVDSWMGQSYAHWDGDTLVIEVSGQNDQTWLDRSGNHHSEQLKVTERYTPVGANHIDYEATLEDPATYAKPWTIRMPLYRRMEANARIMEFRCVEFVEELMFGEWRRKPVPRLQEKEAQP